MAKTYITTVKYSVAINFEIDGVVEKEDIIGAIFGQSEGLLGEEMDLKELQQSGKLGRIEVKYKSEFGKTTGDLIVPSSMNMPETTLLAATIESVEKVGPCDSKFIVISINDVRKDKREIIKKRAKALLERLKKDQLPDATELAEEIKVGARELEIVPYGKDKLPAGPDIDNEDTLIIVEGRADVLTLLRNGIKNVIAMGGSNIGSTITELAGKVETTLFIDGDRGGELNARKLAQIAKIDYLARAPAGKEVEELTRKEILLALKRRVAVTDERSFYSAAPIAVPAPRPAQRVQQRETFAKRQYPTDNYPRQQRVPQRREGRIVVREQVREADFGIGGSPVHAGYSPRSRSEGMRREAGRPQRDRPERGSGRQFGRRTGQFQQTPEKKITDNCPATPSEQQAFQPIMNELKGTMKARLLSEKMDEILTTDVRNTLDALERSSDVHAIVFDGIITKRLAEAAQKKNIKYVIGIRKADIGETGTLRALVI